MQANEEASPPLAEHAPEPGSPLSPQLPKSKNSRLRSRKAQVAAACQSCQSRKIRCDGVRPACRTCRLRARPCEYDVEVGVSRTESLKRKQQILKETVDSFTSLYQYLQTRDPREALSLFERIRNGYTLEETLEFVRTNESSETSTASPMTPSLDSCAMWSQRLQEVNLHLENELLSAASSDISSLALKRGVDCFFSYLGAMFPIFTQQEVSNIMQTVLEPPSQHGEPTQDQIDKKVACGELLAVSALGYQYDRQTLPDGDASTCTPIYQKARLFLDYVLEKDQLKAMRICCCLGIYNVTAKSSLAVSYIDWGIVLGSLNGMGTGRRPPYMLEEDYVKHMKVFWALITVRSWITATLGHLPSPEVARFIHAARDEMKNTGHLDGTGQQIMTDVLQQNMARITVLKANILRTAASLEELSEETLVQMKEDLEEWRNGLAPYMQLDALVTNPQVPLAQRQVTFYMHLFYMSAIMLKARAVLASQLTQGYNYKGRETRATIFDGLHAARNSARLLGLLLDEGSVVKTCWLTLHQCYITYLTLTYATIKTFLNGVHGCIQQQDLAIADRCVDILDLCSTKDRIGRGFLDQLRKIQAALAENLVPIKEEPQQHYPLEFESHDDLHLFNLTEGTTPLHILAHDLLEMLCYPLVQREKVLDANLAYPTIAETFVNGDVHLAQHLASPFDFEDEVKSIPLFLPKSGQPESFDDEGFICGSTPYGWSNSVFTVKT